ncbi:MAG: alpha/beta fold hydrolase [Candidatus Heimdallarchaeota archaeon]
MNNKLGFLLISSVLFASCANDPFPAEEKVALAKAGDLILESGTYFNYKADYGILVVPENRKIPDSRLIHIPIIRIHAKDKKSAKPIFSLTGGPGNPNLYTEAQLKGAGYSDLPVPWLGKKQDVVMVGYRGVDGTSMLTCPEFKRAIKSTKKPLSTDALQRFGRALNRDFQKLKKDGIDINGYNVVEVVDDLEAVRASLGYNTINLLSGSYGAQVAYVYCLRYPESIQRNVMLSPDAPGNLLVWKPEIIDAQLQYYADLWKNCHECLERSPDLLKSMRTVFDRLQERGSPDLDKVKIMTFLFLYDTDSAAQILNAFINAENGDYRNLALATKAFNIGMQSVIWGDFFSKIHSLVDINSLRDIEKEMDPLGSLIGSPMAKFIFGSAKYAGWPIKTIPQKYREHQYLDVPTLLVSGNVDFSSPLVNAQKELLPYLRNGQLVILKEFGHSDAMGRIQPEALQHLVETYFIEGKVDDSKYEYNTMNFTPSRSFSSWLRSIGPK